MPVCGSLYMLREWKTVQEVEEINDQHALGGVNMDVKVAKKHQLGKSRADGCEKIRELLKKLETNFKLRCWTQILKAALSLQLCF